MKTLAQYANSHSTNASSNAAACEALQRKFGGRLAGRLAPVPVEVARQAVEEAARILEGIGFCHLFLPELAEERARKILAVRGFREHGTPIELASVA